ncbi:helix-turn-helix domain-containing protein [uncultured Salinisphaera sp.]|uniref:helix-turn-helix domain-containing protein n=1 Tax=uncultured Salinisphaera sp. TaxID=359372 RepID=UPI0032B13C03|tara:strand:- start:4570 stop:4830 length:261 start_codon:yes stop_codon:yes gene_type:complete
MRADDADDNAQPLSHYVGASLDRYFESLNGSAPPNDLYRMILEQVERPLFERVLAYNGGNQSRTAAMLGINRGTLRKKLRAYNLDQ